MNIKTKFYLYLFIVSLLPIPIWGSLVTRNPLFLLFLLLYIVLYFFIKRDFLSPLNKVQEWTQNYNTGNKENAPKSLEQTMEYLLAENQYLYDDMEAVLNKQIQRLSEKSASLETLYQVSSKINKIHSTERLFKHFLEVFINMTDAHSGAGRILTNDGDLRLIATRGVIDKNGQVNNVLSSDCFCGEVAMARDVRVQFSVHSCVKCIGKKSQIKADVGTIFIPLRYHNKTLGIFNLFFDKEPSLAADERALLKSVADNIAIALDKAQFDEQTKRMEISQERLFLSQEIHDSLAQTIYSLKLQTTVLGDMLKDSNNQSAKEKVDLLQADMTRANQELRELMHNFRVPLDPGGLEASLKNLANRFELEEGISTYLQVKGKIRIPPKVEIQIMRIVQEALSNIRKHSKARNVRILLLTEPNCQLLIEDDGIGFKKDGNQSKIMGNNIGMNIMKERAQRIGAQIDIETEVDEGTRVIVNFDKKT